MAGLQRSAVSFRRQGSSGLVWDDKVLSGELNQIVNQKEENTGKSEEQEETQGGHEVKEEVTKASPRGTVGSIDRSRSNGGGRGYRTGRVSPAIEPPSPKVSACGLCNALRKHEKTHNRPPKPGKRKL